MTTQSSLRPKVEDYAHLEPLPDPPREPDMQQFLSVVSVASALVAYFAHRKDVLVSGAGYLRNGATNEAEEFAPDCVVAFGVNPEGIVARNGYVISEVGKPPDFVLEVASRSTGRRDYTVKREGYAHYGVKEYWRFDHTGGRFHDAAIAGDTLVEGEYEPLDIVYEPDGLIWGHSPVLGLDMCWDNGELRLRDPDTGEYLPTPEELRIERDTAEIERNTAQAERNAAQAERNAERAARIAAEAEADELRERLRRLQQD